MDRTALIYHEDYLRHFAGDFHPERRERLIATMNFLKHMRIIEKIEIIKPEPATEEDLLRVHTWEHVEYIKSLCESGGGTIDMDTVAGPDTYEIAKLSAGGVISAAKVVIEGKKDNSFALVRPPGHHATRDSAMGFCYFNNVAIMIRNIQKNFNLKRVFLLDWDAHAANGTMDIFYNDSSVLNVSIHQDPRNFYPGTGFIEQIGSGKGKGYTANIPVSAGAGDSEYLYIMDKFIMPLARSFKPEMIVISAGQDSHRDDTISGLCLTERGYYKMTRLLKEISGDLCKNRIVVELEGGYNLGALSRSNYVILKALLGDEQKIEIEGKVNNSTEDIVNELIEKFRNYHPL